MTAAPPGRRRALTRRVRGLAIDVSPLRASRDYRLLWTGELVSQIGSQFTVVALLVQVYDLTHSSAAVGLIGAVQLLPMVLVSIGFGPQIDRRDRRVLLIGAQFGLMAASSLLLLGTLLGHPPLALVYGAAALNAAFVSVSMPTRAAMTPNLVPPGMLAQSAALNQVMWNGAGVVGPALGGLIVHSYGLSWAYGIDVASYVVAIAFVVMLRPQRPVRDPNAEPERGVTAVLAGLRYLKGRRVLQSTFSIDIVAMVFGMPRVLFPALAVERFHSTETVGYMFSAVAAGALIGALTSGWVNRVHRQGLAILLAVAVWG
ncbi:MAG: MFS transporter, partial [Actinomycetota bacterium]|nr:MFS transporter [Actinomycetota bacterium]